MKRNAKASSTAIMLALLVTGLVGCTGPGKSTRAPVPAAPAVISGKVVETMDAAGYTYISLEKDGMRTWLAAPQMEVTLGQDLELLGGGEMNNFSSTALNRSFEKIIFSGGPVPSATAPAAPADTTMESAEPILSGKVIETMNAMQYTYIKLEKDGKSAWSAVPATRVAVGDEIELLIGTQMGKFTSKSLNRTFNQIYFGGGVKSSSAWTDAPEEAPAAIELPSNHPKI